MFKNKQYDMIVWVLIVLIVVAFLVFITINKKNEVTGNNIAKAGDVVSVNYTGKLADGTVFDSNVNPQFGHVQPFEFTLGVGKVISGWDKGLVGMKVGEKKTLVIPPGDAYGEKSITNSNTGEVIIPPNAALTFDVELLGIKK